MKTRNPPKPIDITKPPHDDDGSEGVDCKMCADSGLMSTLGVHNKMEVHPCLCERGKAYPWPWEKS